MRISLSTHALIALLMALALIVAAPMVFAEDGTGSTDDSTTTTAADDDSDDGLESEDEDADDSDDADDSEDADEVEDELEDEDGDDDSSSMTKEQRMQNWINAFRTRMALKAGNTEQKMEQKEVKFTSAMDALRAKIEARIMAMRAEKAQNTPTTPVKSMTAEQAACVAPLVADREEALADAFDAFSTDISTALADRAEALADAWALTDATARADAVQAAWTAYKTASKSAHEDLREARADAQTTFRDEVKADCGTDVPADEAPAATASDTIAL